MPTPTHRLAAEAITLAISHDHDHLAPLLTRLSTSSRHQLRDLPTPTSGVSDLEELHRLNRAEARNDPPLPPPKRMLQTHTTGRRTE